MIQVLKEKTLVKKGTIFLMMLAIWAGGGRKARAQDELVPTGFINIDAGAQPQRQTITASNSFPLYDETATVTVTQRIRNGAVFDVSGGMRIAHNLAAGVGFSQFGRAGTGTVTASIPSPRFFDQPLLVSRDADNLTHTERTIHGRITWFMPVSDAFDISLSGGPSFIHVVQGLATGVTVVARHSDGVASATRRNLATPSASMAGSTATTSSHRGSASASGSATHTESSICRTSRVSRLADFKVGSVFEPGFRACLCHLHLSPAGAVA